MYSFNLHAVHNCGSPPTVENAAPPSGMTTFGSLVTYVCRSGYSPDRTDAAVCTMMGWSNVPKCQGTENTCGLTLTVWLLSPVHINFREKDHRYRMAEWRTKKKCTIPEKCTVSHAWGYQGWRNRSGWSGFGWTTFWWSSNEYSKVLCTHSYIIRLLTAHLHAESCFLTVQLTIKIKIWRCVAFVLGAGPLLSCFHHP